MRREFYEKSVEFFRKPGWPSLIMLLMNRGVPLVMACVYIILCIFVIFVNPVFAIRFMGVPLGTVVVVTIIRRVINRPRPYETLDFVPIQYTDKKRGGKCFPSRHCARAGVIAIATLALMPWIGIVMLALSIFVALSRVLAGVHYLVDVLCGLGFGLVVGLIGFWPFVF